MKKALTFFLVAVVLMTSGCNVLIDKLVQHTAPNNRPAVKDCPLTFGEETIQIGMEEDEIYSLFGTPVDVLPSEYGFDWNIYHKNFKNYIQIGIKDGKVVGIYTNSPEFLFEGLAVGDKKDSVSEKFGEAENGIVKGNTRYFANGSKEDANMETYLIRGAYVTFFYDTHENNSLTSINIIDYDVEQEFDMLYAPASDYLKDSFEVQSFYVANAIRVRMGLLPFKYNGELADIALSHSLDMAENNYFSHNNKNGDSVLERADDAQIDFSAIGENLATGSQNSLYMHELLMNSEGHRKNLLGKFTHMGAGIAFNDDDTPYLTQNFLK